MTFAACMEQVKDKNIPNNQSSFLEDLHVENQNYNRFKFVDIRSLTFKSTFFIKNPVIYLDTITIVDSLVFSVEVINIGSSELRVQDILIPVPAMKAIPAKFSITSGQSKIIDFVLYPSNFKGYTTIDVIIINNSIDMEKIVNISGYFNVK